MSHVAIDPLFRNVGWLHFNSNKIVIENFLPKSENQGFLLYNSVKRSLYLYLEKTKINENGAGVRPFKKWSPQPDLGATTKPK